MADSSNTSWRAFSPADYWQWYLEHLPEGIEPFTCWCGCGDYPAIPKETGKKYGRFKDMPMRFVHGHNTQKTGKAYNCNVCGAEVWRVPSETFNIITCSAKCKALERERRRREGKERQCQMCGEWFYRPPSLNAIYCSRACQGKAIRGANHPQWNEQKHIPAPAKLKSTTSKPTVEKPKRVRYERQCPICEERFHTPRSKPARYCSRDCREQARNKEGYVTSHGYVRINVDGKGSVYQHRRVMEEHLGRDLLPNEHVHHRNGDKRDNRIDNLELTTVDTHHVHHILSTWSRKHDRCVRCGTTERPHRGRGLCASCRAQGYKTNKELLADLISAHGLLCYLCNTATATAVDHVIPLSRGGTDTVDNLRPACKSCNGRKGAKTHAEYMEHLSRKAESPPQD